jgi:hypothetical protein
MSARILRGEMAGLRVGGLAGAHSGAAMHETACAGARMGGPVGVGRSDQNWMPLLLGGGSSGVGADGAVAAGVAAVVFTAGGASATACGQR